MSDVAEDVTDTTDPPPPLTTENTMTTKRGEILRLRDGKASIPAHLRIDTLQDYLRQKGER